MLSSRIDETADKLAVILHHIHNTSPQLSRRRRYRSMLVIRRPTLSHRRLLAHINLHSRRTPSNRGSRKVNTMLTRHMLRCTLNRNRMSRTIMQRMMMATTAMAECPCPRRTRPSAGISNSETTNAHSMEPSTRSNAGDPQQQNNALFRVHTWQAILHGGDCAFGMHACIGASTRRIPAL